MPVVPGAAAGVVVRVGLGYYHGQLEQAQQQANANEHTADAEVGHLHGAHVDGVGGAGGVEVGQVREDEGRAQQRGHRGTQRVERLREREPGRGRLRRAEHGHVRVAGHLQQHHAGSQHEQRPQKQPVRAAVGGGVKQEAARRRYQKAQQHAALVANALHHLAGRNAHHEVGPEEAEIHQVGLGIAQAEDGLEVGNQDVVETGDEAHHEKQHRERAQRRAVARGLPAGGSRAGRCGYQGRSNNCHVERKTER